MSKYKSVPIDMEDSLDSFDDTNDDFSDIIDTYTKLKLIDHLSEDNHE